MWQFVSNCVALQTERNLLLMIFSLFLLTVGIGMTVGLVGRLRVFVLKPHSVELDKANGMIFERDP